MKLKQILFDYNAPSIYDILQFLILKYNRQKLSEGNLDYIFLITVYIIFSIYKYSLLTDARRIIPCLCN